MMADLDEAATGVASESLSCSPKRRGSLGFPPESPVPLARSAADLWMKHRYERPQSIPRSERRGSSRRRRKAKALSMTEEDLGASGSAASLSPADSGRSTPASSQHLLSVSSLTSASSLSKSVGDLPSEVSALRL